MIENNRQIEIYRIREGPMGSDESYGNDGAFSIPHSGAMITVVCSCGFDWDHVSVSLPDRCPTWAEMCYIKGMFFTEDECVMQLHPPKKDYVNNHPHCLHLWRPQKEGIPRPAELMVGVKELGVL